MTAVSEKPANEPTGCSHEARELLGERIDELQHYVQDIFGNGTAIAVLTDDVATAYRHMAGQSVVETVRPVDTIVGTMRAERLVAVQDTDGVRLCHRGNPIGTLNADISKEDCKAALECIATGISLGRKVYEENLLSVLRNAGL